MPNPPILTCPGIWPRIVAFVDDPFVQGFALGAGIVVFLIVFLIVKIAWYNMMKERLDSDLTKNR